ncbi:MULTISPECIES: flavin reductase [unclassified Micromonospora]|uniref:flavin reductase n=1 Tax=unclassified Micromonospora TaxID=2617518 RepID=UPI003625941C
MVRRTIPHVPMRPLWRCRNCGAEWPCQPARLGLLVEFRGDRTALLFYLAQLMVEARAQRAQLAQLHPERAPDLHERFINWARARGDARPRPDGEPDR